MRMPIFAYFVVMGFVLTAGLIFISDHMEPQPSTIAISQTDGLGRPFTPEQDPSSYKITGTNFAAPREAPMQALAKVDDQVRLPPRTMATKKRVDDSRPAGREMRQADNPISVMMAIH